jgi:hypothetical protein
VMILKLRDGIEEPNEEIVNIRETLEKKLEEIKNQKLEEAQLMLNEIIFLNNME